MIYCRRIYKWYCILFFFVLLSLSGQNGPIVNFSFNEGIDYDEVSRQKARLVNVSFTKDRFGNAESAVYVSGSNYSYINLGSCKDLKPRAGTISLWVKIDNKIWAGKGIAVNPILLTKCSELSDFYEAYCIYYLLESEKMAGCSTQDSLDQVNIYSREPIKRNTWMHLAISYDDHSFSFYINGETQGKIPKQFETRFLPNDSVMIGHSANRKNLRFTIGSFDDIRFYNRVLSDHEISELYRAPNPNKNIVLLKLVCIGIVIAAAVFLFYMYLRYRVLVAVRVEKEKSEQANKALENELRVHRALMNPHFIFNSLNGLQDFILKKAYKEANTYLIKFSQLLRKIMESNMSDSISLDLEIELLKRYIEIEGMRFEENIITSITVGPSVIPSNTVIPIMMLQPFVENAIWHGLLTKDGEKTISISFEVQSIKYLACRIEDNGVGRVEDNSPAKRKSLAIKFIKQRLELLNKILDLECNLKIIDKPHAQGTIIIILLPILNE